ncbi:Os05g0145650 [Oryza sativa Japonica Group]|uniref:Os05g0145650 protein n=1 Tax=Oryza sativa subsp. japonica TaxID=39947 RepID=A0A0P0WHT4_ORYSJ|nr:Os05g0145650 [Oryza sativa Japonica Group]
MMYPAVLLTQNLTRIGLVTTTLCLCVTVSPWSKTNAQIVQDTANIHEPWIIRRNFTLPSNPCSMLQQQEVME